MFKYYLVIFVSIFLLMPISVKASNSELRKSDLPASYNLKPETFVAPENTIIAQPFVKVNFKNKLYPLIRFREVVENKLGLNNDLLLGSKRISELDKFGNELRVEGGYSLNKLKKIEIKDWEKPSSWEDVMSEYDHDIERIVSKLNEGGIDNKKPEIAHLKAVLDFHRNQYADAVNRLKINTEDKEYLNSLFFELIGSVRRQIDPIEDNFKFNYLKYELPTDLVNDNYALSLDTSTLINGLDQGYYLLKDGLPVEISRHDKFNIIFREINLNSNSKLELVIPVINLLDSVNWEKIATFNNLHRYTLSLPKYDSEQSYYLAAESKLSSNIQLSLQENLIEQDKKRDLKTLLTTVLGSNVTGTSNYHNYVVFKDQNSSGDPRVEVASKMPLSKEDLNQIKIGLYPIAFPTLRLEKTSLQSKVIVLNENNVKRAPSTVKVISNLIIKVFVIIILFGLYFLILGLGILKNKLLNLFFWSGIILLTASAYEYLSGEQNVSLILAAYAFLFLSISVIINVGVSFLKR